MRSTITENKNILIQKKKKKREKKLKTHVLYVFRRLYSTEQEKSVFCTSVFRILDLNLLRMNYGFQNLENV